MTISLYKDSIKEEITLLLKYNKDAKLPIGLLCNYLETHDEHDTDSTMFENYLLKNNKRHASLYFQYCAKPTKKMAAMFPDLSSSYLVNKRVKDHDPTLFTYKHGDIILYIENECTNHSVEMLKAFGNSTKDINETALYVYILRFINNKSLEIDYKILEFLANKCQTFTKKIVLLYEQARPDDKKVSELLRKYTLNNEPLFFTENKFYTLKIYIENRVHTCPSIDVIKTFSAISIKESLSEYVNKLDYYDSNVILNMVVDNSDYSFLTEMLKKFSKYNIYAINSLLEKLDRNVYLPYLKILIENEEFIKMLLDRHKVAEDIVKGYDNPFVKYIYYNPKIEKPLLERICRRLASDPENEHEPLHIFSYLETNILNNPNKPSLEMIKITNTMIECLPKEMQYKNLLRMYLNTRDDVSIGVISFLTSDFRTGRFKELEEILTQKKLVDYTKYDYHNSNSKFKKFVLGE